MSNFHLQGKKKKKQKNRKIYYNKAVDKRGYQEDIFLICA